MKPFQAFVVQKQSSEVVAAWTEIDREQLDSGDVLVEVEYSAINYKDGLAAQGHPGVARKFPLIPGIDAVGKVVESSSSTCSVGENVLVAHAKFGTAHHGGFSQYVQVPADYVHPIPQPLTTREAVCWGTAGFTAAQSVEALIDHQVRPDDGPVLVTGATGGVGTFAVMLLAKLGYQVVASTGKLEHRDWLTQLGAHEVIDRNPLSDVDEAPLQRGVYAGAIDSVGGVTLANVLKQVQAGGCVTACGLVAGHQLETTVYPFILRGITLCGIDSANISFETRATLWQKIATQWKLKLDAVATEIQPPALTSAIEKILDGKMLGRTLVALNQ